MESFLNSIQPYTTIITSVFSLAALGFILRLSQKQAAAIKEQTVAIKERASVLEERLKLAEEEIERKDSIIDLKVTKIGANIGIEEFKRELQSGVAVGQIGNDFRGKIAGRDINEAINKLGNKIDRSTSNLDKLVDQSQKIYPLFQKAIYSTIPPSKPILIVREIIKIEFPDTSKGQAAAMGNSDAQQKFFLTEENQHLLQPHVKKLENNGWKVSSIKFCDNGSNGCYYAEFILQKEFDQNV